jgi:hypothetical protein
MMFALTKAGILPSEKFMRKEEEINRKKAEAKAKKRLEEQAKEKQP